MSNLQTNVEYIQYSNLTYINQQVLLQPLEALCKAINNINKIYKQFIIVTCIIYILRKQNDR